MRYFFSPTDLSLLSYKYVTLRRVAMSVDSIVYLYNHYLSYLYLSMAKSELN